MKDETKKDVLTLPRSRLDTSYICYAISDYGHSAYSDPLTIDKGMDICSLYADTLTIDKGMDIIICLLNSDQLNIVKSIDIYAH